MPIRPSFIATRFAGVETYQFSHLTGQFKIRPGKCPISGGHHATYENRLIAPAIVAYGTRRECFASIVADASFSL